MAAEPAAIARTLSPAMCRTLLQRQEDLFADDAILTGHGMTLKALRRRGIAAGKKPCRLTDGGRAVIAIDPRISGGPP